MPTGGSMDKVFVEWVEILEFHGDPFGLIIYPKSASAFAELSMS